MKPNKNIITIFLLLFSTLSCQKENILPEKKMAHIIADITLLEGSMAISGIFRSEYKKREAYYNSIFIKYHTNSEQFDKSMIWYTKNPKKLESIYEESNKILKKIEEEVNTTTQNKENQPATQ